MSTITIKRDDFIFTIGYQGETAIVDSKARKKYSNLSIEELLEKGLFRAAFCAALYNNNDKALQQVVDGYNLHSAADIKSPEQMKRLLGVFSVPDEVTKVIQI